MSGCTGHNCATGDKSLSSIPLCGVHTYVCPDAIKKCLTGLVEITQLPYSRCDMLCALCRKVLSFTVKQVARVRLDSVIHPLNQPPCSSCMLNGSGCKATCSVQ
ncbi:TPA_asm: hypothetical protein [Powellomyces chytrid fungus MELD virus 3]|nr:TPA_asm: hypothetical protein [Powellomyces chytrid fungus MELD virus 3]